MFFSERVRFERFRSGTLDITARTEPRCFGSEIFSTDDVVRSFFSGKRTGLSSHFSFGGCTVKSTRLPSGFRRSERVFFVFRHARRVSLHRVPVEFLSAIHAAQYRRRTRVEVFLQLRLFYRIPAVTTNKPHHALPKQITTTTTTTFLYGWSAHRLRVLLLSLSLCVCVTLSKARAFVATTTTARAGPFFSLWCSLFFSPFFVSSQKRKNDFKKKKKNSTEGERNARGNEPHQPPPSKLGVDRTRERKKESKPGRTEDNHAPMTRFARRRRRRRR